MEYMKYLPTFREMINRTHPDINKRTIKAYLDTFAALPPPFEKPEKTDVTATIFRASGNEKFCNGRFKDAAISYTVSLMHAPPDSQSAAIAIANRSAALFRLEMYKDCIADIDRALQLPYPDHSKEKIISRRETAVAKLNENSNITNDRKSGAKLDDNDDDDDDNKYAHGENADIPGASDGIKIERHTGTESKLIATKTFNKGEIIVMEKPYLIVPELNENPTFCYHCLKETLCLISCNRCNKQVYCSEECQYDAFLIYHRTECQILNTLVAGNLIDCRSRFRQLRCLITFTKNGTDLNEFWFEGIENNGPDPAELGYNGQKFVGHTRQAFLSLPIRDSTEKQETLLEAAYVVTLLKNHTKFFKKTVDVPIAAKMLIKLQMSYAANHFRVLYVEQSREKASAAYPLISLATHACISNTVAYTDTSGRFILRASNFIKPGDEILYNYCEVAIEFEEKKSGNKSLRCKRRCVKCDENCLFSTEEKISITIAESLRDKLRENPYDIETLWKLKMFLYKQGERYNLHVQAIKLALQDAYRGFKDPKNGCEFFRTLGLL